MHLQRARSGEGLIFEVRDPLRRRHRRPRQAAADHRARVRADPQGPRARGQHALVRSCATRGTASRCRRSPRTRPCAPTGAHVAIIGHITKDELLRFVSGTELANGFVNRFLARRGQAKPGAAVRRPPRRRAARARPRRHADRAAVRLPAPPARPSTPTRGSAGSRSTGRSRAARKACSAPPPAAPKRTSSASPRSTPRSTASRADHPRAPRSGARRLALQPRLRPLDLRRQPRRPHRRRDLGARQRPPAGVTRSEVRDLFSRNKKAREIDRALTVLEEAGRLTRTHARPTAADAPPRSGDHAPPEPARNPGITRQTPAPLPLDLGGASRRTAMAVTERSEGKGAKRP